MNKKTMVIGASVNPERYAYKATIALQKHQHDVIPVGLKAGKINNLDILTGQPDVQGLHTVTLYVGPQNQPSLYDYIIGLKPQRVVFNPGAENPEFEKLLKENNIEPVEACTLVMLSIGNY